MKYINKYLEYLKVVKKYSDKTIESYYDDIKTHIDNIADKVKKLVK